MLAMHHNQGSSIRHSTPNRPSFTTIRRDQMHTLTSRETQLESFQEQVALQFRELSSSRVEVLSLSWIRNVLDVFMLCQEEFRHILSNNKYQLSRPPMSRLMDEYYDKSIKALDICNAVGYGLERIKQWKNSMEIIMCALGDMNNNKRYGEGKIWRAKRSLIGIANTISEGKESTSFLGSHRNRSFGKASTSSSSHDRSLSCSVSKDWSASKQLQSLASHLSAPKGNITATTNGLAVIVYTMNYVLLLVMWILVAAIPCQERGIQTLSFPRHFSWAAPMIAIHGKILEASKKKDRKNACGLMKEVYQTEGLMRGMKQLLDSVDEFPLEEEKDGKIKQKVRELGEVLESLKDGFEPLELGIRKVFRRISRCRTEGL